MPRDFNLKLRHPGRARALLLWGVSGGGAAHRFHEENYFSKYIRGCAAGGMLAVCELDHFAGLVAAQVGNRERLLAIDPLADATDGCRGIAVPTLVVCGANTMAVEKHVSEILRDTIPNGTYAVIADAEHMSPLTHPVVVASLIEKHLARMGR